MSSPSVSPTSSPAKNFSKCEVIFDYDIVRVQTQKRRKVIHESTEEVEVEVESYDYEKIKLKWEEWAVDNGWYQDYDGSWVTDHL